MKHLRTCGIAALLFVSLVLSGFGQTPMVSTLSDLTCDKLDAYYAPPAVSAAPQVPAWVPGDMDMGIGSYNYILNRAFKQRYAADVPNRYAASNFDFRCRTWAMAPNNKALPLPVAPKYVRLDGALFDKAWTALAQSFRDGREIGLPDASFIVAVATPPEPTIIPDIVVAPIVTSGPVGEPITGAPGFFRSSAADDDVKYPDGSHDPTGLYTKHLYQTPFGTTRFWQAQK